MGKFDSEKWKAQAGRDDSADNPRGGMAGTLINDILKEGMPRTEVEALLGPADFKNGSKDYYELGRSPYGIDLEYLVVEYSGDAVVKAMIERG